MFDKLKELIEYGSESATVDFKRGQTKDLFNSEVYIVGKFEDLKGCLTFRSDDFIEGPLVVDIG